MTDRLAELGALQYAVENLSTAGTNPNRLGLAGYIHAAYTDYQTWAAANPGVNPNRLSAKGRLYGYFHDYGFSPLNLFSSGEVGVWYDPSDLTTMFQDRAGTTPVTADGQTVGLILDKSKGLVLGPELVTNGTFDTDLSGWDEHPSFATGTVEWVSGRLHYIGSGSRGLVGESAASASTFTSGKIYKITLDIEVVSGNGPVCGVNASYYSTVLIELNTAGFNSLPVGTHHKEAIALCTVSGSGHFNFDTIGYPSGEWYVDNISVKEISGNHAVAQSDAACPLKTSTGAADWTNYDAVDDVLNTTFTSSLGSSCTVCRANVGGAPTILTGQTIGTSYADSTDNAGLIIINRALTSQETTDVTAWLTAKGAT